VAGSLSRTNHFAQDDKSARLLDLGGVAISRPPALLLSVKVHNE
jgi:hypothetical protein